MSEKIAADPERYTVPWDGDDGCYRVCALTGIHGGGPRYTSLLWMRFASEEAAWEHIARREQRYEGTLA